MKSKSFLFLFILVFLGFVKTAFSQKNEQLIIFLQNKQPISEHFKEYVLDELNSYGLKNHIEIKTIDVNKQGAPKEITTTPSIIYQNENGRSFYLGRYLALDRIINFIRTVKNAPMKRSENLKKEIAIWNNQKAIIGTPIKITALKGSVPSNFRQDQFNATAKGSLLRGMKKFQLFNDYNLPRSARLFYLDFHPWLSEDKTLYISASIYSMFNCVEPVFKLSQPIQGSIANFESVFEKSGALMEKQIKLLINDLRKGDAFEPIESKTQNVSWEALNLALPVKEKDLQVLNLKEDLFSENWTYDQPLGHNDPILQFHFGAPMDNYAGEAKEINVQLKLKNQNSLKNASGKIFVNAASITMGDDELDEHIFKEYLKIYSFPNASYEFEVIEAPETWDYPEKQEVKLAGTFKMIGRPVQLDVNARFEVILDKSGETRLQVHSDFVLPLKALFGIEGPDGPSPSKDQLQFNLNFLMKGTKTLRPTKSLKFTAIKKVKQKSNIQDEKAEEYIYWNASNKIYKAKGSFTQWKVKKITLPKNKIEDLNMNVEIDISSLSERSKLLIKHLKGSIFFDTENYPTAYLNISNPKKLNKNTYEVNAILKIKGKEGKVPIKFEVEDRINNTVTGKLKIDREFYNIGTNKRSKGITKFVDVRFKIVLNNYLNKLSK